MLVFAILSETTRKYARARAVAALSNGIFGRQYGVHCMLFCRMWPFLTEIYHVSKADILVYAIPLKHSPTLARFFDTHFSVHSVARNHLGTKVYESVKCVLKFSFLASKIFSGLDSFEPC